VLSLYLRCPPFADSCTVALCSSTGIPLVMTMIKQRQKAHMAAQRFQSAGTYCGQMRLWCTTGVSVVF
jgi:hypothetical protein